MVAVAGRSVRVLIVDEHAVAGEQLRRDLGGRPDVTVVAVARSAELALRALATRRTDVAVVDAGTRGALAALVHELPVVAIAGDAPTTLAAALTAVDGRAVDLWVRGTPINDLVDRLHAAATAARRPADATGAAVATDRSATGCLLAVAAGVGATASLGTVLAGLPRDAMGVVVSALPAAAVPHWVERTSRRTAFTLALAVDGTRLTPGNLLVATGDRHLSVRPTADGGWTVTVRDGPTVGSRRPSLDVMLSSVAACGTGVAAALLGGIGSDGANGLLCVRRAGGRTVVESPETAACRDLPDHACATAAAEVSAPAEGLVAALLNGAHR